MINLDGGSKSTNHRIPRDTPQPCDRIVSILFEYSCSSRKLSLIQLLVAVAPLVQPVCDTEVVGSPSSISRLKRLRKTEERLIGF